MNANRIFSALAAALLVAGATHAQQAQPAQPKLTAQPAQPKLTEGSLPVITNGVPTARPSGVIASADYVSFASNVISPTAILGTNSMTYSAPPVIPFAAGTVMPVPAPILSQGGSNANIIAEPLAIGGFGNYGSYASYGGYNSAFSSGLSYAYQSAPLPGLNVGGGTGVGLAGLNAQVVPAGTGAEVISGGPSNRILMDFGTFRPNTWGSYSYWR